MVYLSERERTGVEGCMYTFTLGRGIEKVQRERDLGKEQGEEMCWFSGEADCSKGELACETRSEEGTVEGVVQVYIFCCYLRLENWNFS